MKLRCCEKQGKSDTEKDDKLLSFLCGFVFTYSWILAGSMVVLCFLVSF